MCEIKCIYSLFFYVARIITETKSLMCKII